MGSETVGRESFAKGARLC